MTANLFFLGYLLAAAARIHRVGHRRPLVVLREAATLTILGIFLFGLIVPSLV